MRKSLAAALVTFLAGAAAAAQKPPLLPEKDVAALANELSGETAKRNLEGLALQHRQRGSQGFHAAAELIAERARAYGLTDVAILQFPADGKIFYGTQRSRPAWDAEVGDLDVMEFQRIARCPPTEKNRNIIADCAEGPIVLHESYEAEPVVLAEDSDSARYALAVLVDVGEGTKESDYSGKNVKGKVVLAAAQPGAVQDLAVGKFGALGIISYAQNQHTAWWGEDENLIRWGHLETFSPNKTWAFMVSLKTARDLRERLARGQQLRVNANVEAGQHPGNYEVVTATIPGADPKLKDEEIAFSCHLDHQRPGANDNASGCVTILEVARTLQKLIATGALALPARTIRFIWPPEIEGTLTLLNAKPEFAKRIKAVIHMDMVGGGPETKAVFHVTRGPMSLPSFVHDVAWAFAEFANEQSYKFAATGKAEYPLIAPEGGKEPLRAEYSPYSMGSDHDVYQDSSFAIPSIYLNDWPDRYIHTNFDTAANIDPTKLKRAAFIGAASGYFLATPPKKVSASLYARLFTSANRRFAQAAGLSEEREDADGDSVRQQVTYTIREAHSLGTLLGVSTAAEDSLSEAITEFCGAKELPPAAKGTGPGLLLFQRNRAVKGPLAVFGYDYFTDHAKTAGIAEPKLLSYEGLSGSGEEYAYEVLNFADGKRNAQEIRDAVSAEYGPVPLDLVVEYLRALEKIGLVEQVK
ncbi:MAG TPA: M28 family peptidase [Candidatus Dormibacteraeota bacterium]|nr:M28 family peptidase [Candidatus Dormibacteraeota bacterium]